MLITGPYVAFTDDIVQVDGANVAKQALWYRPNPRLERVQ